MNNNIENETIIENNNVLYLKKFIPTILHNSISKMDIGLWFWTIASILFEPSADAISFREEVLAILTDNILTLRETDVSLDTNMIFSLWEILTNLGKIFTYVIDNCCNIVSNDEDMYVSSNSLNYFFKKIFNDSLIEKVKNYMEQHTLYNITISVLICMFKSMTNELVGMETERLCIMKIASLHFGIINYNDTANLNPFLSALTYIKKHDTDAVWKAIYIVRKTALYDVFINLTIVQKMIAKVYTVPICEMEYFCMLFRNDVFHKWFCLWASRNSNSSISLFINRLVSTWTKKQMLFTHYIWDVIYNEKRNPMVDKFIKSLYTKKELRNVIMEGKLGWNTIPYNIRDIIATNVESIFCKISIPMHLIAEECGLVGITKSTPHFNMFIF